METQFSQSTAVMHALLLAGLTLQTTPTFASTMIEIPSGEFVRGADHHDGDDDHQRMVMVKTFVIDEHEASTASSITSAPNPRHD